MGGSTTNHIGSIGSTLLSLSRSSYQDSAPHGPQVTLRRRCSTGSMGTVQAVVCFHRWFVSQVVSPMNRFFCCWSVFCWSRSWVKWKVKFAEADAHLQMRWDWPCPTKSLRESRGAVQNPQIYCVGSDSYCSMFPAFLQMCHCCMWIYLPLSIDTIVLVDTCILYQRLQECQLSKLQKGHERNERRC